MSIKDYSTTAANNANAGNVSVPEGMAPGSVNDEIRDIMADMAEDYADDQWRVLNVTATYTSPTTFTLPGNLTAIVEAGRAIRINDNGTLKYTKITSSAYTTLTTVTVSSLTLTGPINQVSVGDLTQSNDSLPEKVITKDGIQILSNKLIQMSTNTLSGTQSQFNSACSDNDFAFQTDIAMTAGRRGALVYHSGSQTIPHNTPTNLVFNSETYDTHSIHDLATNTDRLVVPSGVTRVKLIAHCVFVANSLGIRTFRLLKNGSYIAGLPRAERGPASAFAICENFVSAILEVSAGDYFTVEVTQTTGSDLGMIDNWFAMEIIA